ncbi:MAG: respiratory nitrate reductase subunit gamma [Chloroflexi bacterium]|nr:respiratory nitrate reductase subunit gamma [Chloroflexota bacterium]
MALPQQTVYWLILQIVVLGVFVAGLAANVAFWLRGSIHPGVQVSAWTKICIILAGMRAVLRPRVLGKVLLDALFQRRLFGLSPLRWLAHFGVFWGMIALFLVGSVGLMLAEKGLVPITRDTPWFALLNEVAGLMVIFAALVAVYRRFVARERQLKTAADDVVLIVLLAFIVLSGYGLEAARLATFQVAPAAASYSFVGYAVSMALRSSDPSLAHQVLWWLHAGSGMAFVAYVPYSKLFHMFAGPVAIAANTAIAERLPVRSADKPLSSLMPKPVARPAEPSVRVWEGR